MATHGDRLTGDWEDVSKPRILVVPDYYAKRDKMVR